MPIRRRSPDQGTGQLLYGRGVQPARAYGGAANGQRWIVADEDPTATQQYQDVRSHPYELAFDPRTGSAVRDSFGRYVYLASDRTMEPQC